jgi:hypothetical protein
MYRSGWCLHLLLVTMYCAYAAMALYEGSCLGRVAAALRYARLQSTSTCAFETLGTVSCNQGWHKTKPCPISSRLLDGAQEKGNCRCGVCCGQDTKSSINQWARRSMHSTVLLCCVGNSRVFLISQAFHLGAHGDTSGRYRGYPSPRQPLARSSFVSCSTISPLPYQRFKRALSEI